MTTSNSATGHLGPKGIALTTKRRQAGTSLVEILVVIVIFLIGILAVVQIFPRGFRLLLTSRNGSVATALGRDEVERLKSHPDFLPEQVLAVRYVMGSPQVDNTLNPLALGPLGDSISPTGFLSRGGDTVAQNWLLASGPNVARRIVGEGQRVPAPRRTDLTNTADLPTNNQALMAAYGGLMVLNHGPVDRVAPIVAYANDLTRSVGEPRETTYGATVSVEAQQADGVPFGPPQPFSGALAFSPVLAAPFEFFVVDAETPNASLLLPATYNFPRAYRLRMSAYVGSGANYRRIDYVSLCVRVPKVDRINSFVRIRVADLLAATPGALPGGASFGSAELDTIRLAPLYDQVANWTSRATVAPADPGYVAGDYTPINPFEVKVVDRNIGTLLFSPAARQGVVNRPGGVSEPLIAKVDYDVLDWRVIREEFRVTSSSNMALSLQSLKVGAQSGPDGRPNGGIWPDPSPLDPAPSPTDNVAILDLTTGLLLEESAGGVSYIAVDKSRGSVTLLDSTPGTPVQTIGLVGSDGVKRADVSPFNRTFRVLYRARNEWAIQLLKGASQYTAVNSLSVGAGQYFIGDGTDGLPTRVYFPAGDAKHKVTIDSITYVHDDPTDMNAAQMRTLEGQDFVVRAAKATDGLSLAYVDLTEVDPFATTFTGGGQAVRGVKGASLAVRVLWNPEAFTLADDGPTNIGRAEQWGRSWRPSMTETFLRAEETR